MFLKRERPETDDFVIKISCCEGKVLVNIQEITRKFWQVLADTILVFQNTPSIFNVSQKKS